MRGSVKLLLVTLVVLLGKGLFWLFTEGSAEQRGQLYASLLWLYFFSSFCIIVALSCENDNNVRITPNYLKYFSIFYLLYIFIKFIIKQADEHL